MIGGGSSGLAGEKIEECEVKDVAFEMGALIPRYMIETLKLDMSFTQK